MADDSIFKATENNIRDEQRDFLVQLLFLAMTVSTLLAFVLAHVYRFTHRGTSYSQSFLVTMFMMSIATAVVEAGRSARRRRVVSTTPIRASAMNRRCF